MGRGRSDVCSPDQARCRTSRSPTEPGNTRRRGVRSSGERYRSLRGEALAGWATETSAVNTPLTDSDQRKRQVDGFSLFAIGRWRRHSRTPKLTTVFCWLCPRGLRFSFRNDQARSERSGRAVGVTRPLGPPYPSRAVGRSHSANLQACSRTQSLDPPFACAASVGS